MKLMKGITLIEILVAMGLSAVVFLIVSTLIVTILNSNTKSQRQELFEQAKNDIQSEISNQVRWAEFVEFTPGNMGEIKVNPSNVTYNVDAEGRLMKNNIAITPEDIKVTRFTVENFGNTVGLVSLQVTVEMQNRLFTVANDSLRFVVSQRKTTVELSN